MSCHMTCHMTVQTMQSHGNRSDCWLLNYVVTYLVTEQIFSQLCGAKFCPLWLWAEFTTAHASVLLRCCPMAENPHSFFNTSHVATWVCSPIQHTEASSNRAHYSCCRRTSVRCCHMAEHLHTIIFQSYAYCLFHCTATIQGWRLFLQKAWRHQLWLDKVGTSEMVMVARRCH